MSCPDAIVRFAGPYHFLSNFYIEPDGTHVEGEYQAHKSEPIDWALADMNPREAKQRGGKVALRADWEDVKLGIMAALLYGKFTDHKTLRAVLLGTGYAKLIEGNYWGDTFWGVCRQEGRNWLGVLLMNLREELRRG